MLDYINKLLIIYCLMNSFDKNKGDLNLLKQVEIIKNYNKLQERLKKASKQIMKHKMNMSLDDKKSQLDNYLKVRKEKTILFRKKLEQTIYKSDDTKMLTKILEYNRKLYSFSVPQQQKWNKDPNLHHNSKVSFNKIIKAIDQQNQKIHYRIRNASSAYSQQKIKNKGSILINTFFLSRKSRFATIQTKARSNHRFITQYDPAIKEESLQIPQFNLDLKTQRDEPNSIDKLAHQRAQSKKKQKSKMMCRRSRCQKIASKIYQNKLKYQKTISSRLFVKY